MAGIIPATAGLCADRTLSITDFSRIQVTGAMRVFVTRASATSVRISGDGHDLNSITAEVQGQTLRIGVNHFTWGSEAVSHGPLIVYVTTPHLRSASLNGSGSLVIDGMRDPKVEIAQIGAGDVRVNHIQAEHLSASASGTGQLVLIGHAEQAALGASGSGMLDARDLTAHDLVITDNGAASVTAQAARAATVTAAGSGTVNVIGHPACTVSIAGGATINCGN